MNRIRIAIIAALFIGTAAGAADAPNATCVAGLGTDPKAIYDASVASVQPSTDLKALLTDKTRGLVKAGTVERGSARDSARAALKCLELVQKSE